MRENSENYCDWCCAFAHAGQFGSGITAFFIFLRWIVLYNLANGAIWMALVVLPQAGAFDYGQVENNFYLRDLIAAKVSGRETASPSKSVAERNYHRQGQ